MSNTPFLNARCRGSSSERGRQQGEQLRDQVHESLQVICRLEAFRSRKPAVLPYWLFERFARRRAHQFLQAALADSMPDTALRISTIAEGSGAALGGVELANALEPVLSDLRHSTSVPPGFGCSAVAVTGSMSEMGGALVAHNFDYLPMIQPLYVLREERPANGLRSLVFSIAPLAGAVDGINEAGLAATLNYGYVTDGGLPGPTISMWLSEMLDRCHTVNEALAFLNSRPRSGGGLVMLADQGGDIASLELSNKQAACRRPVDRGASLFHTNLFCNPSMKGVELSPAAVHSNTAPMALRGRRVHASSELRNKRFLSATEERGPFSLETLATLMADHGTMDVGSPDTICMHSDFWQTTACIQLSPRERRLRVAYNTACRAKYTDFAL